MGQRGLQLGDCAEQGMAGPDSFETVPGWSAQYTSGPTFRLCPRWMGVTDLKEVSGNASCRVECRTPTGLEHSHRLGGAVPCATRVRLRAQSRWLRWLQRAGEARRVGTVRQAGLEGASLLTEQEQEEAGLLLGQRRG